MTDLTKHLTAMAEKEKLRIAVITDSDNWCKLFENGSAIYYYSLALNLMDCGFYLNGFDFMVFEDEKLLSGFDWPQFIKDFPFEPLINMAMVTFGPKKYFTAEIKKAWRFK